MKRFTRKDILHNSLSYMKNRILKLYETDRDKLAKIIEEIYDDCSSLYTANDCVFNQYNKELANGTKDALWHVKTVVYNELYIKMRFHHSIPHRNYQNIDAKDVVLLHHYYFNLIEMIEILDKEGLEEFKAVSVDLMVKQANLRKIPVLESYEPPEFLKEII